MARSFFFCTSSARKISIAAMLVGRKKISKCFMCVLDMDLKTCKQKFFLLHLCVNFFISRTHTHTHTTPIGHSFHLISVAAFIHCNALYFSLSPSFSLLSFSTCQMYFCLINMYPYLLYFILLLILTSTAPMIYTCIHA